ncbi:HK97 gp10 family phage protein [Planococcus rifietoensis]|uniref:HK97 gp10 family phage protein n=1 Tax=Planococcus rifietoensis TaxID=200991 RepID=UPI00384BE878
MAKISDLSKLIAQSLQAYSTDVEKGLEEAKVKVTKEAVKSLKSKSPKGETGEYAKGWRTKRVSGALVIHNATRYQLTHLLEKGHAKVSGGRVPARVHIKPVEEQAIADFEKEVEKVISG